MYNSGRHYEQPGPSFRPFPIPNRPWSPAADNDRNLSRGVEDYLAAPPQRHRTTNYYQQRRRDASEVSVEALDLADYAMTLRRRGPEHDPYENPQFDRHNDHRPFNNYLPVDRPFSALSRDTMHPPPSLVSAGTTSHSSHAMESPYSIRRPQSLPAVHTLHSFPTPRMPAIFAAQHQPPIRFQPAEEPETEPDVRAFPAWSRGWYEQRAKEEEPGYRPFSPMSPQSDIGAGGDYDPYPQFPATAAPQRNLLPWSSADRDPGHTITESVKEERMKMLEREFGAESSKRSKFKEEHEEGVIGSVDENGKLITAGPLKRTAMRWLQGILALGSACSGLYSALYVKPNPPAPPAGRPITIVLYALSCLSLIIILYFFAIRPFFCGARSKKYKREAQQAELGPAGMMVLPVATPMMGGKKGKGKGGKKGKKGKGQEPGSVQVNLIVDPTMFGSGRGRGPNDTDEEEGGDYEGSSNRSRRGDEGRGSAFPKRRSFFAGMVLETRWKRARSDLKWNTAVDSAMMSLWMGEFVSILLLNKPCPAGGFDAWCDGYNVNVAGACLLAFAFATSFALDIKDLRASSQSPRTRP